MTEGERPLASWPSRVKVKNTLNSSTPPGTPQSARYFLQSSFEIELKISFVFYEKLYYL